MSQDYCRVCPSCATENDAAALRCVCGALLTGTDLTRRHASAPADPAGEEKPAIPSAETASPSPEAAALLCPYEDCGQPNPAGSTTCLYCNRPLASPLEEKTGEGEPESGAAGLPEGGATLFNLPSALRERYRIVRLLPTAGAEAELLLVEPPGGGETCVAKIYRHGIHPKPEVQARLKDMDPAHKVRLLESGTSEGFAWELMEYCPLGSLRAVMKAGPLDTALVRVVATELAGAVAAVHGVKLIHRDLKPENVLVRRRDPLDLVLTDFGISSLQDATLLFTGVARTLAYGAPETIAGIMDHKADYWSLGMILLEAVLGRHPFADLSDAVILHRLTTGRMDLSGVRDSSLRMLLRGLLLRDPKRRWGAEEVRRWLAGDPGLVEPAEDSPVNGVGVGGYKPYRIGEDDCQTPEQLAVGLARNWPLAVSDLNNGLLLKWSREEARNQNLVRFLIDLNFEPGVHGDVRLLRLITFLAPGLPPVWRGESVALGAVLRHVGHALKGSREAVEWLEDLRSYRVLDVYSSAGNREMEDILNRWQAGEAGFEESWAAAEKAAKVERPGGVTYFDDVAYGLPSGLKRPRKGLVAARLLAVAYDPGWGERLKQLVATEFARLEPDCPWLRRIGKPEECSAPCLLVMHAVLHDARQYAGRAKERREQVVKEETTRLMGQGREAQAALQEVVQLSSHFWYLDEDCLQMEAHLAEYFRHFADLRSAVLMDEEALAIRSLLGRAEPYAIRLGSLLDELTERRAANRGWFNINTGRVAGGAAFLVVLLAPTWLPGLLAAVVLIAAWRLLPNYRSQRRMQRLGQMLAALFPGRGSGRGSDWGSGWGRGRKNGRGAGLEESPPRV